MDELTTSIVGIDFPNEDASKSNRRMECMMWAPGDLVELRLEPTNPFDSNAIAIFSDRGTQLGYVSAERVPLIGKQMKEDDSTAVFQAMHGKGPISGSGSEAVYLPCPTRSMMSRSPRLPGRCGRRRDGYTIPTLSIQTMTDPSSVPKHRRIYPRLFEPAAR